MKIKSVPYQVTVTRFSALGVIFERRGRPDLQAFEGLTFLDRLSPGFSLHFFQFLGKE
ncbi:MAG: hypothetical protein U9N63_03905 [Pseudomonadota bacterium]|nr:hypothetical protein [Pseudomonadota bacterium]